MAILIVEKQFKILRKNDLRLLIKIMHEANTKSISYVCCGNQRCGENMCIKFFPLLKNHLKKSMFQFDNKKYNIEKHSVVVLSNMKPKNPLLPVKKKQNRET